MPDIRLFEKENNEEYHIPASDTKGHSARQHFRCIPAMSRMVEQVVQAKKFPYRTKGDLLRHALHRHMNWLNKQEPMPSIGGQVAAILEIMRDEEMNNDFSLVFAKLDDRINHHLQAGDKNEAVRLILIIKGHIGSMPDGFWKRKYEGKLEDKYGKLVGKANKAKINEWEDE